MKRSADDEVRMTDAGATPPDPVAEQVRRRVAKWAAKYTPERLAGRLAFRTEQMQQRYRTQAELQGRVEQAVAQVTDAACVPGLIRFWYNDFGRELSRIWRTVPTSCQESEFEIVRYKWAVRGLDPILLDRVEAAVIEVLEELGILRNGR